MSPDRDQHQKISAGGDPDLLRDAEFRIAEEVLALQILL